MLSKIKNIESLMSLYEQLKKYWGSVMILASSIWYSISSITSPISDKIGHMLFLGITVPIGVLFFIVIMKIIIAILSPKYSRIKTFFEFEFKNGSVNDYGKRKLDKSNIYSYYIDHKRTEDGKFNLFCIITFKKDILPTSVYVESYNNDQPSVYMVNQNNRVSTFNLLFNQEGKYKIYFNR